MKEQLLDLAPRHLRAMDGKTLDGQTLTVSKAGSQTQSFLDSKAVEDSISIDQLKEALGFFVWEICLFSL